MKNQNAVYFQIYLHKSNKWIHPCLFFCISAFFCLNFEVDGAKKAYFCIFNLKNAKKGKNKFFSNSKNIHMQKKGCKKEHMWCICRYSKWATAGTQHHVGLNHHQRGLYNVLVRTHSVLKSAKTPPKIPIKDAFVNYRRLKLKSAKLRKHCDALVII